MQYYGTLGDYVGGLWGTVVSLLGFLAVVATLWHSRKYEYRSKVYQVFIEMLRTHEDVVQSLSVRGKSGRDVFGAILDDFYQIYKLLNDEGHFTGIVDPVQRVKIAYLITYYGPQRATADLLGELKLHDAPLRAVDCIDKASARFEEHRFIKEMQDRRFSDEPAEVHWRSSVTTAKAMMLTEDFPPRFRAVLNGILSAASRRTSPLSLNQVRERVEAVSRRSYFTGHQNRLGHYFRNLYVTYRYISEASIPKKEQDRLGRVVRSKLSNYEQAVLALNALTPLGAAWRQGKTSLMKRFMPIRAVPKGFFGFDGAFVLHEIYSEVDFEWEDLQVDA